MGAVGESEGGVLPGGGSARDGRVWDDARFGGLPRGVDPLFAGETC